MEFSMPQKTATVQITAREVCTSCHVGAVAGDVPGQVTFRNYVGRDFAMWWEDVKRTRHGVAKSG